MVRTKIAADMAKRLRAAGLRTVTTVTRWERMETHGCGDNLAPHALADCPKLSRVSAPVSGWYVERWELMLHHMFGGRLAPELLRLERHHREAVDTLVVLTGGLREEAGSMVTVRLLTSEAVRTYLRSHVTSAMLAQEETTGGWSHDGQAIGGEAGGVARQR